MTTITNRPVALARRLLIAFEVGDEDVVDNVIHPAHVDRARADRPVEPEAACESIRVLREPAGSSPRSGRQTTCVVELASDGRLGVRAVVGVDAAS